VGSGLFGLFALVLRQCAYRRARGCVTHRRFSVQRASPFSLYRPLIANAPVRPPIGGQWLHEDKCDGYRVRTHVIIFSKRGSDFTRRFESIEHCLHSPVNPSSWTVRSLRTISHPDFRTHQARKIKAEDLCVWCQVVVPGSMIVPRISVGGGMVIAHLFMTVWVGINLIFVLRVCPSIFYRQSN
jgi:hypothetical protein